MLGIPIRFPCNPELLSYYTDSLIQSMGIPLVEKLGDNTHMDASFYGPLVILYLFLGGASAGAFCVMSVWSLAFHRIERHVSSDRSTCAVRFLTAFKTLLGRVYALAFALLAISMLCLLFDLRVPEHALLIYLRPHPTPLTFGAYSLAIEALLGLVLACANLFTIPHIGGRVKRVLEVLCVIASFCVMTYTGVFLAGMEAVAFWHRFELIALFVFSAFSTGLSLVMLVDYFIQGQTLLLRAVRPLQKAHLVCLTLEAAALVLFAHAVFADPAAARSIELLMEPDMLATALVGAGWESSCHSCLRQEPLRSLPAARFPYRMRSV